MAIDFPNSPSVGDTFTSGDRTFRWNGTTWDNYIDTAGALTHADNHTSGGADPVTLAQSQVTGLTTALSAKVDSTDARLTDARTPTAHAASHASGGSDAITVAQSQVTNLTTDLAAKAPLASPTFTGTATVATAVVTGDLTVDTNTLRVDSTNNRVGVGTTSPQSPVHVSITSNDSSLVEGLRITASNSGETDGRFYVGQSNSNPSLRELRIDAYRGDTNRTPISFTQSTSDGTLERMRIDASGRITMPYQTMVSGTRNGVSGNLTENPIKWNRLYVNSGNYNASTGLFTAPIAGRYLVSVHVIAGPSAGPYLYIYKNGVAYFYNHAYFTGSWVTLTLSGIVDCSANDTISLGCSSYIYGDDHNGFSIVLIG